MDNEYLFIVEGPDDEDFFRQVILPYCERTHPGMVGHTTIKTSSSWTAQDYKKQFDIYGTVIIVIDLDPNENGCPAIKKNNFCNIYGLHHRKESVCVVVAEIESWYLAVGSDCISWLPLRFRTPKSTETIVKEDLRHEVQRNGKHLSVIMQMMLDDADITSGKRRNTSLVYFLNKLDLLVGS